MVSILTANRHVTKPKFKYTGSAKEEGLTGVTDLDGDQAGREGWGEGEPLR